MAQRSSKFELTESVLKMLLISERSCYKPIASSPQPGSTDASAV